MKNRNYSSYSVNGLGWFKWAITGVVLVAFVSLVWLATNKQETLVSENVEPPLVAAPEGMVKERPEQPGGMEVPNRDKKVFDLLAGQTEEESASKQALRDAIAKHQEEQQADLSVALPVVAPGVSEEQNAQQTTADEAETATVSSENIAAATATNPATETAETPVAVDVTPTPQPTQQPAPQTPHPAKPAEKAAAPAASGSWGVQLGSFKSAADAQKAGADFAKKFGELGGLSLNVQKADLGSKGVYHRVRFMGLANREAAVALCGKLKAKGQSCLQTEK